MGRALIIAATFFLSVIHALCAQQGSGERARPQRPFFDGQRPANNGESFEEKKARFQQRREEMKEKRREKLEQFKEMRQKRREEGGGQAKLMDERFPKMLELASLPPDKLDEAMNRWPQAKNMPPERREKMKQNLEKFRSRLREDARKSAEEMGMQIPPEKEAEFTRAYWRSRVEIEQQLRSETESRRRELMEKAKEKLGRELEVMPFR